MRRALVFVVGLGGAACGRFQFEPTDASIDGFVARTSAVIPATANVWGAGHATPPAPGGAGAGVLPTLVALDAGRGRVLQLADASGTIDYNVTPSSADGTPSGGETTAASYGGLVDVICQRGRFLTAVFLDDLEPQDPAPSGLSVDVTAAGFAGIGLRQFFFVGDGRTGDGTGVLQTFAIPDAATRLFFGFDDRTGSGGADQIGSYGDNTGTVAATIVISSIP